MEEIENISTEALHILSLVGLTITTLPRKQNWFLPNRQLLVCCENHLKANPISTEMLFCVWVSGVQTTIFLNVPSVWPYLG
jgi:hypothetical protein